MRCHACGYDQNLGEFNYCGRCGNQLGLGQAAEYKQVTVMFADISGFTAMSEKMEPETVRDIVNQCLSTLTEAIVQYGGWIDKYIGDAIMALFGAPISQEEHAAMALHAALAMLKKLDEFNETPPIKLPEPLGLHIGINSGRVVAGPLGTSAHRRYTVLGDVVNLASRLEDASERGEVLISEETYRLTSRLFRFNDREPISVKGKQEPVTIYQLVGARSDVKSMRGLVGLRSPLVGRERESKVLLSRLRELEKRRGGVIVVSGEAGMGKTRMVGEARRSLQEEYKERITWLEGRGLSYGRSRTYSLFIDMLMSYLGVGEDDEQGTIWAKLKSSGSRLFEKREDEVVPYLAALLGLYLDRETKEHIHFSEPHILQQRIFLAMGELVEAIAMNGPLVLVFDDMHWADTGSVNLVEYLMTVSTYVPLAMLCITRPERDTEFWKMKDSASREMGKRFVEISLRPLSPGQSRQLVREILQVESLPAEMENAILSRAEGNPLFVEEVLRVLIEDKVLTTENGKWHVTRPVKDIQIPDTLQGVLTARIDRLEDAAKRVLQIASVVGRVFPSFVLMTMVDEPEKLNGYLQELQDAELIREKAKEPDEEYIFKHILTQEVAYRTLLHQQRKKYHQQVGDCLARLYWERGEEYAAVVAHHYNQGEQWKRAFTYLVRAGDAARTIFDNEAALDFYNRAMDVATNLQSHEIDPEQMMGLRESRGLLLFRRGQFEQAVEDYKHVLELARQEWNKFAELRALYRLGSLYSSHCEFDEAHEYLESALTLANEMKEPAAVADVLNKVGAFHFNYGELQSAMQSYGQALELVTPLDDKRRSMSAMAGLAYGKMWQGNLRESLNDFEQIIAAQRQIGDLAGLVEAFSTVIVSFTLLGEHDWAGEVIEETLALHNKLSDLNLMPHVHYYSAMGKLANGNIGAARRDFEEGLRIAREIDHKVWHTVGLSLCGYFYACMGMSERGLETARESARISESLNAPLWSMRSALYLGMVYRCTGKAEEAVGILAMAAEVACKLGFVTDELRAGMELAWAYYDSGREEEARSVLPGILERAGTHEMAELEVMGMWLQGLLEGASTRSTSLDGGCDVDYDEAVRLLKEAAGKASCFANNFLLWRINLDLSDVYEASGMHEDADMTRKMAEMLLLEIANTVGDDALRESFLSTRDALRLRQKVK